MIDETLKKSFLTPTPPPYNNASIYAEDITGNFTRASNKITESMAAFPTGIPSNTGIEWARQVAHISWMRYHSISEEAVLVGGAGLVQPSSGEFKKLQRRMKQVGIDCQNKIAACGNDYTFLSKLIVFTVSEHDGLAYLFNLRLMYVKYDDNLKGEDFEEGAEGLAGLQKFKAAFTDFRDLWFTKLDGELRRRKDSYDRAGRPAPTYQREWEKIDTYTSKLKQDIQFDQVNDLRDENGNWMAAKPYFDELEQNDRLAKWDVHFKSDADILVYQLYSSMKSTVNLYQTIHQPRGFGHVWFENIIGMLLEQSWQHVVKFKMDNMLNQQEGRNVVLLPMVEMQKQVYTDSKDLPNDEQFGSGFPGIGLLMLPGA